VSADRGRDTSRSLTDVRTVLSRAETALADLTRRSYHPNMPATRWDREADRWVETGELVGGDQDDPDIEEMCAALEQAVSLLDKWRRTGRPPKK